MTLDFPQNPAINDTYTLGSFTWKWDGNGWTSVETSSTITTVMGPTGPSGLVTAIDPLSYNSLTKTLSLKVKPSGGIISSTAGLLIDTSVVPTLSGSNTFTGSTYLLGSVNISGTLTASGFDFIAKPIDDISNFFDGKQTVFSINSQGTTITNLNPFRLLINLNGIIQSVILPDYIWMNPIARNNEVWVDNMGYLHFSRLISKGSTFDGRVIAGETTNTIKSIYPFRALDILIGE